jgi:hypothetical protein
MYQLKASTGHYIAEDMESLVDGKTVYAHAFRSLDFAREVAYVALQNRPELTDISVVDVRSRAVVLTAWQNTSR